MNATSGRIRILLVTLSLLVAPLARQICCPTVAAAQNGVPSQCAMLFAVSTSGNDPLNYVFRYEVTSDAAPAVLSATITDPTFDQPSFAAFGPSGELFVVNRGQQTDPSGTRGSVTRILNALTTASGNGALTSDAFSGYPTGPHGIAFRGNEMFIANAGQNNVLRYIIDANGDAVPNGAITGIGGGNTPLRGVTVSPWGELFVSQCCGTDSIARFVFDADGTAIPNGTIAGGGLSNPHGMAFSPWGELFVANFDNSTVSRFAFDATHVATPNGVVSHPEITTPIEVAFSPWGELFVSNQMGRAGIARLTFDASYGPLFAGFIDTPTHVAGISFGPHAASPGCVETAELYGIASNFSDPGGRVYRFRIDGQHTAAVVDGEIVDQTFDWPGNGITFTPAGELLVINRGDPAGLESGGSITRILDAGAATPTPNGSVESDAFAGPHYAAFRGNELFVAQNAGGDVLRFLFDADGNVTPNGRIANLSPTKPRGIAVSPWGELFVSQCCGVDTVSRYTFDAMGNAVPNGAIVGGGLSNPHGMAFGPDGDLFVANLDSNSVVRIAFDPQRNATFEGQITSASLQAPIDLAFSPWGELFVTTVGPAHNVTRFLFNSSQQATFNGSFSAPGVLGGIAFAPAPDTDDGGVTLSLPGNISIEATSAAGATVGFSASADDDHDGSVPITCAPASGGVFPLGTTTVTCAASDSNGNTATGTFAVSVVDTTAPAIACGSAVTVASGPNGKAAAPDLIASATPTDAVTPSGAIVFSQSPAPGAEIGIGTTPVTITARDAAGNASSCSIPVTVTNLPPSASAGGPYTVVEGGQVQLTAQGTDPEGAALVFLWDLDNDGDFDVTGQTVVFSAADFSGPYTHTLHMRASDSCGEYTVVTAQVNVTNAAPVIGSITPPSGSTQLGAPVSLSASFTDAGRLDTHVAFWNWGDGATTIGTVSEANGAGTATGTHTYAAVGTYTVTVRVNDGLHSSQLASIDVVVEAAAATPVGSNVPVTAGPAQLAFDAVTAAGTTSVSVDDTPPAQSGFAVLGSYYEITTTASFTGTIVVTLPYDPVLVANPSALRLYHYTGSPGAWEDITTAVDTVRHTISGRTSSLSPFVVGLPSRTFDGFHEPINVDGSSIFQINRTVPVKFRLMDANGAPVTTAVARIYIAHLSNGVSGTEQEPVSTSEPDTGNRFRHTGDGQYRFNWGTRGLAQGTWQIRVVLDDGTSHCVIVSLLAN